MNLNLPSLELGSMNSTTDHQNTKSSAPPTVSVLAELLDHLAHHLPDQGPIEVFIHHNTLHSFEDLPFHQAVIKAGTFYSAKGYLQEHEYKRLYDTQKISPRDLAEARQRLGWYPEDCQLPGCLTTSRIEQAYLDHPAPQISSQSRKWWLEKRHPKGKAALALWQETLNLPWPEDTNFRNLEFLTLAEMAQLARGQSLAATTRACLVPACSVYLDRGMSENPTNIQDRFWPFLLARFTQGGFSDNFGDSLAMDSRQRANKGQDPASAVLELIDAPDAQTLEAALKATLCRHPGWAGMFHRLECHPEDRPHTDMPVRLIDFLAGLLLVEYHLARNWLVTEKHVPPQAADSPAKLRTILEPIVRSIPTAPSQEQHAWQLACALSLPEPMLIDAECLSSAPHTAKARLVRAAVDFAPNLRKALWQEALESNLRSQVLAALTLRKPGGPASDIGGCPAERPELDVMTCIDEREESLRRILEEQFPSVRTWGAPGFFGLPVAWLDEITPGGRTLAPLGVRAAHIVRERPTCERTALIQKRNASMTRVARLAETNLRHRLLGAVAGTLGALATFPMMVAGLFIPRWRLLFKLLVERFTTQGASSKIDLSVNDDLDGVQAFTVAEQANRVQNLLRTIGMTGNMAQLIVVLGHGSSSANNPHKSAYDCGACGGHEGYNNARLLALLANCPAVRSELAKRGLIIPKDTWVLGAAHDTSSDRITFIDTEQVPDTHTGLMANAKHMLDQAAMSNAAERCRRFATIRPGSAPAKALAHVMERSVDPAQPRPELGHATNAMAFIGRRSRTRGLFLDRRCFLVSYDAWQDENGAVITAILSAITPVCVGINLEYYFSRVDPVQYGSGTKLPHNPVSLVGVMEGACGDLRTGLPRQMVEIHTPVRLLMMVEAPLERLIAAARANPDVARKIEHQWFNLVAIDPASTRQWRINPDWSAIEILHSSNDLAAVPFAPDSRTCHRAGRDDLPIAWIGSPNPENGV